MSAYKFYSKRDTNTVTPRLLALTVSLSFIFQDSVNSKYDMNMTTTQIELIQ